MLYFLRGSLPWQGLHASHREDHYRLVLERKQATNVEELCRDHPPEFAEYMTYVRRSPEDVKPNHRQLRQKFRRLFARRGFEHDNIFDWTMVEFQRQHVNETDREDELTCLQHVCNNDYH